MTGAEPGIRKTPMDLKREMNRMKKHREKYGPVLMRLLEVYSEIKPEDFPVDIRDMEDIGIALELLDIGYIHEDALVVKKGFNEITGVYLRDMYPLTEKGDSFLEKSPQRRRYRAIRKLSHRNIQ